jgi:ABC-type glycerol-3-phosphate transport system permease component
VTRLPRAARRRVRAAVVYSALVVVTLVMCFPLIWAVLTSVRPDDEMLSLTLVPHRVTGEHYRALLTGRSMYFEGGAGAYRASTAPSQHFLTWFANSTLVTVATTVLSVAVSTLAAYSVTRFRFAGQSIAPCRFQVFRLIVVPLAVPGIVATAIFSFIVAWNDYLIARIFINSITQLPLTVGVMHFFEGTHVDWGLMMAAAVLITLPLAVLFMFVQRQLVVGFGAGAVKG